MTILSGLAGGPVTLPSMLSWTDEYAYTPLVVKETVSLTGATIRQYGMASNARPITLSTPDGGDWITKATLDALYTSLLQNPSMTLTLDDNRTFDVAWSGDTPISAEPLFPGLTSPGDAAIYRITLKLKTL